MCPWCSSAPFHHHNWTQAGGASFICEIARLVAEGKEIIELSLKFPPWNVTCHWPKQVTRSLLSLTRQRWKILPLDGISQLITKPDVNGVSVINPKAGATNILNSIIVFLKGDPCTEEMQREYPGQQL